MKLYHYVHCPFCIRVRLVLGYLKIEYQSKVLRYDDEETPIKLCGKKSLPIMQWSENEYQNESLDIIKRLDPKEKISTQYVNDPIFNQISSMFSGIIFSFSFPYLVYNPEFDQKSRDYFCTKKGVKYGDFNLLVRKRKFFEEELQNIFPTLNRNLKPYFNSEQLNLTDILLASTLWNLYLIPEFQFPLETHSYLQRIKNDCQFDFLGDCFQD